MSEPTVCANMLTRNRPELAKKAVECFRVQTYPNKRLLVWNTGPRGPILEDPEALDTSSQLHEPCIIGAVEGLSIGELRNDAAECAVDSIGPEIIVHWDDDDWSHPNRIAEQVALLQSSGADVVGYNEMVFWRDPPCNNPHPHGIEGAGAWLYTATLGCAPALGTSLCYWRKTWEKQKFEDAPHPNRGGSEYGNWLKALNCKAVSAIAYPEVPRMIARIHAGNAGRTSYDLEKLIAGGSKEWKRVPEWDERVKRILQ
jgi:hypothetical protein